MDLTISLETSCDLTPELMKKYDFKTIDMDFFIDGEEYSTKTDDVVSSNLYKKMREGKKTLTSQINQALYEEFFEKLLKSKKDVLHIAFSTGLSGTYYSAKKAADELNQKHKNKVYVIDSLCGCSGHGYLGVLARDYCKEAETTEDVVKYVENIKYRVNHYFTLDTLKYLVAGGRIKATTAFIGNLLNIKPILVVDNNGKIILDGKTMGRKKSLGILVDKVKTRYDKRFETCFISHSDCEEDAKAVAEQIQKETFLKPVITNIGPIFGCHCGPGAIAVYFVGQNR